MESKNPSGSRSSPFLKKFLFSLLILVLAGLADDRFEADRAHRPQQIDDMNAAPDTAEKLPQAPVPAAANLLSLEFLVSRQDARADRIGMGIHGNVDRDDFDAVVEGQPHVHVGELSDLAAEQRHGRRYSS